MTLPRPLEGMLVLDLGQIYNGQITRGLVLLFLAYPFFGFMVILTGGVAILMAPLWVPLWVWNIYDAYRSAERLNRSR